MLGLAVSWLAAAVSAAELERIEGCRLEVTDWADGDSFQVVFPDGKKHTIRLYAVDCIERKDDDDTDARRLRDQRSYFGIGRFGGSAKTSVELAKQCADEAKAEVISLLEKPFTVHTAWADGGGDGKFKRYYGFIELASGRDLGEVLVEGGHARAHGVARGAPDGRSRDEYKVFLGGLELKAAKKGTGVWEHTDWERLAEERRDLKAKEEALNRELGREPVPDDLVVDPNTVARDELMKVPGIGEATALAIIEARPYRTVDELTKVSGIGPRRLESMRRYFRIDPAGE